MIQRFRVLLLISDVPVPTETGPAEGGFYVTVVVAASRPEEAVDAAIEVLRASAKYQSVVGARAPIVIPQEVGPAAPDQRDGIVTGFVFFLNEGGSTLA